MKIESELVSNPKRMAFRSDDDSLQNCVGVHLSLNSAQVWGVISSAFTADPVQARGAFFFGSMMVSCGLRKTRSLTKGTCLGIGVVVH